MLRRRGLESHEAGPRQFTICLPGDHDLKLEFGRGRGGGGGGFLHC
jgi:hypothetical protein